MNISEFLNDSFQVTGNYLNWNGFSSCMSSFDGNYVRVGVKVNLRWKSNV